MSVLMHPLPPLASSGIVVLWLCGKRTGHIKHMTQGTAVWQVEHKVLSSLSGNVRFSQMDQHCIFWFSGKLGSNQVTPLQAKCKGDRATRCERNSRSNLAPQIIHAGTP